MARVLVMGMSGTGKSTVVAGLIDLGLVAIDTDDGYVEPTPDGLQQWRLGAIAALLDAHDHIAVAGCEENMIELLDRFDHRVLLSAPRDVIVQRVSERTGNDFGKSPPELDRILADLEAVEPLLRRIATVEMSATEPIDSVVAAVAALVAR